MVEWTGGQRDAILDVTADVLQRDGACGLNVTAIMHRAGVSRTAFSWSPGFVATPLSVWPAAPALPNSEPDGWVDMATAPVDQVVALSGVEFLQRTAALMQQHRPHLVDRLLLAPMRRLGLVTGEAFDVDALDARTRDAIEAGAVSAQARMERMSAMHPVVDGWSQPTFTMGVYGTGYWRRAIIAKIGLGANLVEDATYPVLFHDAAGNAPVGEVDYLLRAPRCSTAPGHHLR